jgi:hypothetical protein
LSRVYPDEIDHFVDVIRLKELQPVHPEFFFLFSLSIRPTGVIVSNHYRHVLSPVIATIEMGSFLVLMEDRWLLIRLRGSVVYPMYCL